MLERVEANVHAGVNFVGDNQKSQTQTNTLLQHFGHSGRSQSGHHSLHFLGGQRVAPLEFAFVPLNVLGGSDGQR